MEALTTTSLPSSPSASIPLLNRGIGCKNRWTWSRGRRRRITEESPYNFMFRYRPKASIDHQLAMRPFLFPSPSSSIATRGISATELAVGACSWSSAAFKYNGRSSVRVFMVPSSSSSPIPSEEGPDREDGNDEDEVERALELDGNIPGGTGEFLRRVSSRAYDMRRNLLQTIDSSSYEVLDHNPWREDSKPVFVLTQGNNQLCTMKIRQSRSEVERELGMLFSKTKWDYKVDNKIKQARSGSNFNMLVEDIREGVLVFEDEVEASRYCELLQGGTQRCEGIAEIEVSSVFDICQKMRALAVLFRRGRTPPLPQSLEQNLKARKRSLEDQDII